MNKFPERLKELRIENNLSQRSLVKTTALSQQPLLIGKTISEFRTLMPL